MPLSAQIIVSLACQDAKCPGFTQQGGQFLNAALQDYCQNYDLDAALGTNLFSFNSAAGNGSGPYNLPADYLRTQVKDGKDEFFYTINGVPYPLIQCTKAEYDWMVQTPGFQNFPYYYATDLSPVSAGLPAQLFVWPPASGSYPCTQRYYRLMPDIVTPETSSVVPWFTNTMILQRDVAGRLMGLTGDDRQAKYLGDDDQQYPLGVGTLMRRYLKNVEDREGAVHTVGRDRRRWGRSFDLLKNTKTIGWAVAAFMLYALSALSPEPAHATCTAPCTAAQLLTDITTNWPDNTTGLITPLALRTNVNNIVNSTMPTAPVTSGNLACFSGTTGLLKDCAATPSVAPVRAVVHPSSGNLYGSGCLPAEAHSILFTDQNFCSTADVWQITSSDPSAVWTAIVGGTRTTGDIIKLNFTFGAGTCVAGASPACDAAYTAGSSDTLQNIANGVVCAIANNSNLFTLNGGTCLNGVITPAAGQSFGGYASGSMIGYTVEIANGIAFDFNSTVALKVVASVSGAATETVTIGNTTCGTRCSYSLDNNPAFQMVRVPGIAPQPGSTLNAIYSIGPTSACPTGSCINYGVIANWVGNSTAGSLQSAWLLQTPNTAGALSGGTWFGQGAYSNNGGAPFAANAAKDMGTGTFNVGTNGCYYLGFTNAANGDQICQNGSGQLAIQTTTDTIVFGSANGIGFNTTPTGNTLASNLGFFVGGSQIPTTGAGISVQGTATPVIQSFNFGTSAYLPTVLLGTTWDFKPSNSATSGWTFQANELGPDADNVTNIGDASHNVATVFTKAISGMTTPLSVAQGGTGNAGTAWAAFTASPACGTATITTTSARSKTLGKTTWAQVDFTITAIGTCAVTNISFNLPNTAQSAGNLTGRETANTNKGVNCIISASGTTGACLKGDATTWNVNDHMIVSGVYENQ